MNRTKTSRWLCAMVATLTLIGFARPTRAQNVTTGNLSGTVTDQQGGVLPGATVTATHEPTGTKYEGVTSADGRYQMPAVRVGGPYTVTATLSGFKDKTESDVNVGLGEAREGRFQARAGHGHGDRHRGRRQRRSSTRRAPAPRPTSQEDVIENLPTIRAASSTSRARRRISTTRTRTARQRRRHQRRRPQQPLQQHADRWRREQRRVRSRRHGHARRPDRRAADQLDAIQEMQLVVSPYDVRQGGFSGGGVNAVTKSGTNTFTGTGYFFGRNESLVGHDSAIATVANPTRPTPRSARSRTGRAASASADRSCKNKAFFFANLDIGPQGDAGRILGERQHRPAVGSHGRRQPDHRDRQEQYGYDPGNRRRVQHADQQRQVLRPHATSTCRAKNQLTARINYVDGIADADQRRHPVDHRLRLPGRLLSDSGQDVDAGRAS